MAVILRLLTLLSVTLALAAPSLAAPPRAYTCTNMMGGNPFRLTIAEDGVYTAASHPDSYVKIGGEGNLELRESGIAFNVIDGPLRTDLKIEVIHIMSSGLTPSGSTGLFDCKKAK